MEGKLRILMTKEEEIKLALNNSVIKDRVQSLWMKAYGDYYRKYKLLGEN